MNRISLKTLAALGAAALTLTAPAALAETADSALVYGGKLNLRQTPSLSAKVLGQYPTGTLVEIVEHGGDWHRVEVGGREGYMMSRYLTGAETVRTATVRTNTGAGLNLREAPDTDSAVLTSAKNGSTVTVLQQGSNWCRVRLDGREGFMSSAFLTFSPQESAAGRVAVVSNPRPTQVLNLRQQPSLDARVLSYYRNGAKVTILTPGDTWHKVQTADGRIGYMMAEFLTLTDETAQAAPFQAEVFNINGGAYVNLRKGASLGADILRRVEAGASVTVLEHGTDWCRVSADGTEGYMSTWFLKW